MTENDPTTEIAPTTENDPTSENDPVAPAADGGDLSRRGFVLRGLAAGGVAIAAAIGVPVVAFGSAPAWQWKEEDSAELIETSIPPTLRSDVWTSVGKITDFEVGAPRYVIVDRPVVDGWVREDAPIGVYVVRKSDTEAVVFDPHCTHLGCPLSATAGSNSFVCPCHGGSFDTDGNVTSGPPPHAMFRYEVRVDGGDIAIRALLSES
jgi:menaquinol-cytochrome c reductase iron-sulfur subunit